MGDMRCICMGMGHHEVAVHLDPRGAPYNVCARENMRGALHKASVNGDGGGKCGVYDGGCRAELPAGALQLQ